MSSQGNSALEKPELSIRVFDGIGIEFNNEPLSIGGPRQQRLLALLTIRAGAVCDIDWRWSNTCRATASYSRHVPDADVAGRSEYQDKK